MITLPRVTFAYLDSSQFSTDSLKYICNYETQKNGKDRRCPILPAKLRSLSWLLHQSEWILPIPGTTSIQHLEENINAGAILLSKAELDFLGSAQ